MEIDPLLVPILANVGVAAGVDIVTQRAAELESTRRSIGVLMPPVPASVTVHDRVIPTEPPVSIRVYTPEGAGLGTAPRAGLLYAHGGGWATGSPEVADSRCGAFAAEAGVVVVSVDYRLIPEHRFPAGLDDVTAALGWFSAHATELGVDAERIAIGGESSGANLAAATALRARDAGGPAIAFQLFEVAVLDLEDVDGPSRLELLSQFPDFARGMELTRQRYLDAGADPVDPLVSPLLAPDLSGLPPALLLAAEVDPVRDDSVNYAERLNAAGVPARARIFPGIVHGTEIFTLLLPTARDWLAECVAALKAL